MLWNTMNGRTIFAILVAARILAGAESSSTQPSSPGPLNEALLLMEEGQFAAARVIVADLVDRATHGGSPPASEAQLLHLLGTADNRLGRYVEAEAVLSRGVQLCNGKDASVPELTIALLVDLAEANLKRGNPVKAERSLRRASAVAAKQLPPGHTRTASIQHSLGVVFWVQGKLSRAERAFRAALTILEREVGPDHADVAVAAGGLGGLLFTTGRPAEAVPLLARSKTIFERAYGPTHPDTIGAAYALATALLDSAPTTAEIMLREAMANWRLSQPERHPHTIKFLNSLARSLGTQQDHRGAEIASAQALQLSRDLFGSEHPHTVTQMYAHALLLREAGRRKEAGALEKEANRIRQAKGYSEANRHQIDVLAFR